MAKRDGKTNLTRIMDCIQALFEGITWQHPTQDYYCDGILVNRSRDPRAIAKNLPEEYRSKHRAVSIVLGRREKDPRIVAGRRRWKQHYAILGMVTMTKDQDADGRKLDELVAEIQDDLQTAIASDPNLIATAGSLGIPKPSITAHFVDSFENDEGANFPDALFAANGSFTYDEFHNVVNA